MRGCRRREGKERNGENGRGEMERMEGRGRKEDERKGMERTVERRKGRWRGRWNKYGIGNVEMIYK